MQFKLSLYYIIAILFFTITLFSCGDDVVQTPKPRGFPKIEFPERGQLLNFTERYCDFVFRYPSYAQVIQDSLFFDDKPEHPCWFDIYIPTFDAKVHCTYYPIDKDNSFEKLRDDAFTMVNKHNMKATYIDELKIQKPNGVGGYVFNVEGAAASPFQFYLTDTTNHFLRGALYFNTQSKPDSLAPVVDFVKYDIMGMINSFDWK